jgi:hypothetical protein
MTTTTRPIWRDIPSYKSELAKFGEYLGSCNDDANICISGGAYGADKIWEACSRNHRHDAVIMSFAGHNHYSRTGSRVIKLTAVELTLAKKCLSEANKHLKRSTYDIDLLKRNYYQIKYSNMLYAISNTEQVRTGSSSVGVEGGTAWACQMFLLQYLSLISHPEPIAVYAIPMYLFDMKSNKWYRGYASFDTEGTYYQFQWKLIDYSPPKPFGVYTGIGSRNITASGKMAIEKLYT